jgi:Leucine-rich repeat (LRR) protein
MTELIEIRLDTNAVENNLVFGFQGQIPASIGDLKNLVRLDLYENRLTGTLPKEIGSVGSLEIYDVAFNTGIEGFVPEEYENLVNLQEFYITGTSVNGTIPDAFCTFEAFIEVDCGVDVDIQCSCCTCGN